MTEKVGQIKTLSENLSWRIIKNTVSQRLKNGSLSHTFQDKKKILKRTKLLNKELKKHPGLKSYSQYVEIKSSILKKFPSDEETDLEETVKKNNPNSTCQSVRYSSIYSSDSECEIEDQEDANSIPDKNTTSNFSEDEAKSSKINKTSTFRCGRSSLVTPSTRSTSILNSNNKNKQIRSSLTRSATLRKLKSQSKLTSFLIQKSTSEDQDSPPKDKETIAAENETGSNSSSPKSQETLEEIFGSQPSSSRKSASKRYSYKAGTIKTRHKTREDVKKNLSSNFETKKVAEESFDKNNVNDSHNDSEFNLSNVAQSTQYPDDSSDNSDKTEDKNVDCEKVNKKQPKDSGIDSCEEVAKKRTRERQLTESKIMKSPLKPTDEMHDSSINENGESNDLDDDTFYEESGENTLIQHSGERETLKLDNSELVRNVTSRERNVVKIIGSEIVNKKYKILDNKQYSVSKKINREEIEKQSEIPDESEMVDVCLEDKSGTETEENFDEKSPRKTVDEKMEIDTPKRNTIENADLINKDSGSEEKEKKIYSEKEESESDENGKIKKFIIKRVPNKKNDNKKSPKGQNQSLPRKSEQRAELIRKIERDKKKQEIIEKDREDGEKFSLTSNEENDHHEEIDAEITKLIENKESTSKKVPKNIFPGSDEKSEQDKKLSKKKDSTSKNISKDLISSSDEEINQEEEEEENTKFSVNEESKSKNVSKDFFSGSDEESKQKDKKLSKKEKPVGEKVLKDSVSSSDEEEHKKLSKNSPSKKVQKDSISSSDEEENKKLSKKEDSASKKVTKDSIPSGDEESEEEERKFHKKEDSASEKVRKDSISSSDEEEHKKLSKKEDSTSKKVRKDSISSSDEESDKEHKKLSKKEDSASKKVTKDSISSGDEESEEEEHKLPKKEDSASKKVRKDSISSSDEEEHKKLSKKEDSTSKKVRKDSISSSDEESDKEHKKLSKKDQKVSKVKNQQEVQSKIKENKTNECSVREEDKAEKKTVEDLNQSTEDIFASQNSNTFKEISDSDTDFESRSRVLTQFPCRKASVSGESKQDEEEIRLTLENDENETFYNLDDNKITIDEHKIEVSENIKIDEKGSEDEEVDVVDGEVMSQHSLHRINQIKNLNLLNGSESSSSDEESSKEQVAKKKKKMMEAKSLSSDSEEDTKKKTPKKKDKKNKIGKKSPGKEKEQGTESKKKQIEGKSQSSDLENFEDTKIESPKKNRSISPEKKVIGEKSTPKGKKKKSLKEKSRPITNEIETEVESKEEEKDASSAENCEFENYMKDGVLLNKQGDEIAKLKETIKSRKDKNETQVKSREFDNKNNASTSQFIERVESENADSSRIISDPDIEISVDDEPQKSKRTKKDAEAEDLNYVLSTLRRRSNRNKIDVEDQVNRDSTDLNKSETSSENQKKLTQLADLVEKENLLQNDLPISVSVDDISADEVIGVFEIPKTEVSRNWIGKTFTFSGNGLKIGDISYQTSNRKLDTLTSVLNCKKGKTSCKPVNTTPVHSVLVQPRNVIKSSAKLDNSDEEKENPTGILETVNSDTNSESVREKKMKKKKMKKTRLSPQRESFDSKSEIDKINESHNKNELKSAQKRRRSFLSSDNEDKKIDIKVAKKRKLWNVDEFLLDEKPIVITPDPDPEYIKRYNYDSSEVEITDGRAKPKTEKREKEMKSPLSIVRKKIKKSPKKEKEENCFKTPLPSKSPFKKDTNSNILEENVKKSKKEDSDSDMTVDKVKRRKSNVWNVSVSDSVEKEENYESEDRRKSKKKLNKSFEKQKNSLNDFQFKKKEEIDTSNSSDSEVEEKRRRDKKVKRKRRSLDASFTRKTPKAEKVVPKEKKYNKKVTNLVDFDH